MDNLKPFDPQEIDTSLTRVVAHGGENHLLFPYIDAVGAAPQFKSVGLVIFSTSASIQDLQNLSKLVVQIGAAAVWYMAFSTPWLISRDDVASMKQRISGRRPQRD